MTSPLETLSQEFARTPLSRRHGRIAAIRPGSINVTGLGPSVRVGDRLALPDGATIGEVIALDATTARAMTYQDCTGIGARQEVMLEPEPEFRPSADWQGRIIDAMGAPLDGRALQYGSAPCPIRAAPPPAARRRAMGARLRTGVAALDTMLPLVRGQRIGVFAGSGVGKSTLLASIAREAEVDRVVLALIGERGRELRHFTDQGPRGARAGPLGCRRGNIRPIAADQAAGGLVRDGGGRVLPRPWRTRVADRRLADPHGRSAPRSRADRWRTGKPARISPIYRRNDRGPCRTRRPGNRCSGRHHCGLLGSGRGVRHGRTGRRHDPRRAGRATSSWTARSQSAAGSPRSTCADPFRAACPTRQRRGKTP